jgi:hypothetical protein
MQGVYKESWLVIEDTHVKVILHMSSYCCYDKIIGHNNSDDFENVWRNILGCKNFMNFLNLRSIQKLY